MRNSLEENVYNNDDISCEVVKDDVIKDIKLRSKRTKGGCMLYHTSRGKPTSKIFIDGKRRQLARILYVSKFECDINKRRLRRRSICSHKRCIEPDHYRTSRVTLNIFVTTFDPCTYKDITKTVHIEVCDC